MSRNNGNKMNIKIEHNFENFKRIRENALKLPKLDLNTLSKELTAISSFNFLWDFITRVWVEFIPHQGFGESFPHWVVQTGIVVKATKRMHNLKNLSDGTLTKIKAHNRTVLGDAGNADCGITKEVECGFEFLVPFSETDITDLSAEGQAKIIRVQV